MPTSLSQPADLTCPQCGHRFAAEVWLIVDAAERPDLLEKAQQGTLHEVACPNCGPIGQLDAPLLLFRPDATPPLLFSPAQETSAEQDREHARQLVSRLRQALGPAWRDEWLAQGLPGVPRPLLPLALKEGLEAAQRKMQEQAAGGLPIPPEFRDDLQKAKEAEGRYLRHSDRAALDQAAAAWARILDHPAFPAAPGGWRTWKRPSPPISRR